MGSRVRATKGSNALEREKRGTMNAVVVVRNLTHPLLTITSSVGGTRTDRVRQRRGGGWPRIRAVVVREDVGSFYDRLGIPASGSLGEIKKAYRLLARKYHPDVSPPDRAQEYARRFIEVHEAYETLSDPGRRAVYDRHMVTTLPLAFSAGRRRDKGLEERSDWRDHWCSQLAELQRRRMNDSENNLSWAARLRRRRAESSKAEVP